VKRPFGRENSHERLRLRLFFSQTPEMSDSPSAASASVFSRPPSLGSTASSAQPGWSEVTPLEGSRYRMRLGGSFGPAWMAQLCSTLAEHKLSIERAHAMRGRNQSWLAELTVQALDGAGDPFSLPYTRLGAALDSEELKPLVLDGFELVATQDHGGSLRLTIEAHDMLGLLGTLLHRAAELELYPIEMHIDTQNGLVHDRLWLSGRPGAEPTAEAEAALRDLLRDAIAG
jgi:hypothetical protein